MPNLKLAVRTLVKAPFVSTVAIVSLALGIGANTAIFSLIQRVLLRSLPVPEPDRLVNVLASRPNPGSQTCNQAGDCDIIFSYPMFRDLEKAQTTMTGLAAHRAIGADLAFRGKTVSGDGMAVSGSYFSVLQLKPALGRLLGPEDDRTVGGQFVAVLGYHYWSTELGADPSVLNQTIVVNGKALTIVGVAPPGFDGTTLGTRPRVFVPITMMAELNPWFSGYENRRSYWVYLFGRLKPGVTRDQAQSQLNAIYHPIITDVELALQKGIPDRMRAEFRDKKVRVESGSQGQSSLMGQTSGPLLLLMVVTGIVLLVACTNVANLLLARAANRSGEIAVRSSLGASRGQLLAQLLTEAVVLALAAGVASIAVARLTLSSILSFLPGDLTRNLDFGLDGPVLLFAAALSLGTCVLFGLLPALHATRADLVNVVKTNAGRVSVGRGAARFRSALVVGQIALSMALLSSAGLFIRSMLNVARVDLGIRTDSLVTFAISPEQIGYRPSQNRALFQRVETDLAAVPGVAGVTSAQVPILMGWSNGNDVQVEGFKTTPETDVNSRTNTVGVDYFKTLGVPILSGREFNSSDDVGTTDVVVVNEAFAEKFKLGREAVGKHVTPSGGRSTALIVGLVKNAAYDRVKGKPQPLYFRPYRQDTTVGRLVFYARARIAPSAILRQIPPLIAKIDPNLPVSELKTLPEQVKENVFLDRMITTFSAGFAILATLLAAVGLYGVLAHAVAQRTREIGVRMALGADSGQVRWMVMRQVGTMTVVGGALGMAGAFGIGRSARSLLYGLASHDAVAFVGAATLLTLVALGAGYLPANRASRVHPMQALRSE